ncbi:MAG: hypothetical protein HOV87_30485 [Catenulispora sp.]|nr:hypothetical protein [Catenulispora sp.]
MSGHARSIARIAIAVAAVAAPVTAASGPARADVSACSATPGAGQYSATATATCPAGAGTFTFRVAANCYDTYPTGNLQFEGVIYGPWVQASASFATSSSVHCNGYVPGSGVASGATIQTA